MIFVVRAGHALHVSKIRGQYCLTSSTVKEAHQFRSVKGADKVAAYFRRHHGVYAVVDDTSGAAEILLWSQVGAASTADSQICSTGSEHDTSKARSYARPSRRQRKR